MLCKNCGSEVGQGKFCTNCGMEATPPISSPKPVYCTHCGSEIGQAKFCPNCGAAARPAQSYPAVQSQIPASYPTGQTTPVETFNLFTAYLSMFKKYAQFHGRSRRSEYWFACLANSLLVLLVLMFSFIPTFLDTAKMGYPSDTSLFIMTIGSIIVTIYGLAVLVPSLALQVRRLHDTGKSGWLSLLSLIPYVGSIVLLIFCAQDSQPGANKYGENPKGQ